MNTYDKAQQALQKAYSSSDIIVLALTFVGFFIMTSLYFILGYFFGEDFALAQSAWEVVAGVVLTLVFGGILFLFILGIGMILIRMMRQRMLGNSLQVEYSDFAWLRDWANQVAADFDLPRVEIFVTQDPYINAYAFGFIKPYCIVLHSGSVRYLSREELKVVVVHEMAHIKYGHTNASVYLQPFLSLPLVGVVATWIAGFWQRRAELTSDRLALMYLRDPELVKNALIKVHVGPDVAKDLNEVARQWLDYNANRPMNRFVQTFSTHPFLVRRLNHIDEWAPVAVRPSPVVQPDEQ